jgi:ABC-type branched-subunit amino acid transport system permease subunit
MLRLPNAPLKPHVCSAVRDDQKRVQFVGYPHMIATSPSFCFAG